jgi:hypothetical protein
MNRVSAAFLAIACLATGYVLNESRVRAAADEVNQARRLPDTVRIGDHVTLTFANTSIGGFPNSAECSIAELSSGWVRCAQHQADAVVWYDLTHVVAVSKGQR